MILPILQHSNALFADLNTTSGTEDTLDVTVDGKLTGSKGTNHEETSADTGVRAAQTEFLADLDEARDSALAGETLGLVDLGEHGVGGLGNKGSSETSDQTGTKVDTSLGAVGEGLLVNRAVDHLGDLLEDDELGHGVRDPVREPRQRNLQRYNFAIDARNNLLLEQDRSESGVESANTLLLEDAAEAAQQTASEGRLGDETDTGSLEGAEGNVGHEFSAGGRGKVDSGAVVSSGLVTELVDGLLLEELVTTELEGTLEEVTGGGRAETSEESASTLFLNDLAETTDHTTVIGGRVKLDTGLDAAN